MDIPVSVSFGDCSLTVVCSPLRVSLRERSVVILNPGLGDRLFCSSTDQHLEAYEPPEEEKQQPVTWTAAEGADYDEGLRLRIQHEKVEISLMGQVLRCLRRSLTVSLPAGSEAGDLARSRGLFCSSSPR